jgi:phage protein D
MAFGVAILVDGSKDDQLTARASVVVDQCLGEPTTFALRLPLDIGGGDLPLLVDDRIGPGSEITIVAESAGARACLVHGPVCGQHIILVRGGAGNVVEVLGADASIELDREDKARVFTPQSTDEEAASQVLDDAGFDADTEATDANHSEDGRALVQCETDFRFLQRLAARNGFFLWFTSTEKGDTTGHFRTADLASDPVRLAVNGDKPALDRVEIQWDVERPTAAVARQSDSHDVPVIGSTVSKSPLTALGTEPFAELAGAARTVRLAYPADQGDELTARAKAAVIDGSWFATARGSTTVARAKAILAPSQLINLQGVGTRLSGHWLCYRVRHEVGPTAHNMEVELIRNAWGTS